MKQVLDGADAEVIKKIDLWQNDEMIYKMKSKFGLFEISSDCWDGIFIMAPKNQPAIKLLEEMFSASEYF